MSHSSMFYGANKTMAITTPNPTTVWPELIRIQRSHQDPTVFKAQVCTLITTPRRPCYSKWLRARHVKKSHHRLSVTRKRENCFIIRELLLKVAISSFFIRIYPFIYNEYFVDSSIIWVAFLRMFYITKKRNSMLKRDNSKQRYGAWIY